MTANYRGGGSCLKLGAQCTYFWKNLEVFKLKFQGFRRKQVKYMHLSINRSNLVRFSNFFFSRKLMKIVIWLNIGCAIVHPAHPLPPPLVRLLLRFSYLYACEQVNPRQGNVFQVDIIRLILFRNEY